MANIVYDYFRSYYEYSVSQVFLTEIKDPSFTAKLFQMVFTVINSLCSWLSLKNTSDRKEMVIRLLEKQHTICLCVLVLCCIVLTQGESSITYTNNDFLSRKQFLIVKSSQPGPRDIQSSTRPETCKQVLISIQREQTGFDKESRRFTTHWKTVPNSEQAKKVLYGEYEECGSHKIVDVSRYSCFGATWRPLSPLFKSGCKESTMQSYYVLGTLTLTVPLVIFWSYSIWGDILRFTKLVLGFDHRRFSFIFISFSL